MDGRRKPIALWGQCWTPKGGNVRSRTTALKERDPAPGPCLFLAGLLRRDLMAALAAAKRDHVAIITTAYGKSFTVDGFSQWMRDAIKDAGLPLDCQPHGLRKATGRRLAEAGATAKMIMSVLGHTTLAEAERYTIEADQAGLAEDAVIKLEGHKANRFPQTSLSGLGKRSKTENQSRKRQAGAPKGNRTPVSALRGPRPNR